MEENYVIAPIAHIHTDFPSKFGIPRQSGLAPSVTGTIVFTPEYRDANALRGLEGYDRIWLIWGFSMVRDHGFSPTVKPPKLGGNTRMGVFATRSPFRPNRLGLSTVRLEGIRQEPGLGSVLVVSGADLMDGTPIYDIKPYLPYVDSHPDARGGFASEHQDDMLPVSVPDALLGQLPAEKRDSLLEVLSRDPRPGYMQGGDTPFSFPYAGFEIRFRVENGQLTVYEILPEAEASHVK